MSTTTTPRTGFGSWLNNQPYLLLTLTALFWGGNAVVGRAAPGEVSPAVLTLGRWGFATLICATIFWPRLKAEWPMIRRVGWIPLALGAVGYAGFNFFLYSGLVHMPATNAAILQSGIPLLIFLLNFAIFRQRIRWVEIIGFSISLVGVAVVVTRGDPLSLLGTALGMGELFMVGAAITYAGYTLGLRFKPALGWQTFLTLAIAGAAFTSIFLVLQEGAHGGNTWPTSGLAWRLVAYAAVVPSILAQGFYIRGVETVGPNRAGLFINLVPLFTALLAVLLIGEQLQIYHGVAMVLVIGGVSLAQKQ
ncbi:MAG: DMT family transporter [Pseudomonadota bacterium]